MIKTQIILWKTIEGDWESLKNHNKNTNYIMKNNKK